MPGFDGACTVNESVKIDHPKLVKLLQLAYSAEKAAAFAYIGHAGSVRNPDEKVAIKQIEMDEWQHRETVLSIMGQYHIPTSRYYEIKYHIIGRIISCSCYVIGWFADLITAAEESLTVKEFKTSGRAYSSSDVESSLQPTCYVHAVRQTFGKEANVEYTVLVKTKTPKVQRIKTARYAEDCGRLGDLVQTIQRAVDFNVFYPVESPMNCSNCPYRQPCREWGQGSKPQSDLVQLEIPQEAALCSLN